MSADALKPVQVAGVEIPRDVLDGIRAASRDSGVSFEYMLAQAHKESRFQTNARHSTTSASGLYQFTRQTWLSLVKDHGADHGIGDLAAHIRRTPKGELVVDDPAIRTKILDLRKDHRLSAAMAGALASDNKAYLEKQLKRPVNDAELSLAHFFGGNGAAKLLKARASNPDQAAAAVLPRAARLNRGVFFGPDGRPRSVAEVTRTLDNAIERDMRRFAMVDRRSAPIDPPLPQERPAFLDAPPELAHADPDGGWEYGGSEPQPGDAGTGAGAGNDLVFGPLPMASTSVSAGEIMAATADLEGEDTLANYQVLAVGTLPERPSGPPVGPTASLETMLIAQAGRRDPLPPEPAEAAAEEPPPPRHAVGDGAAPRPVLNVHA